MHVQCGCHMFAIMGKIVTVEIIPDSISMFEFALPLCSCPSAFTQLFSWCSPHLGMWLSTSQWQLWCCSLISSRPLYSTHMWLRTSDHCFTQHVFQYQPKLCTYSTVQLLHDWCHMKLLLSWGMFCVHHHTTMHHSTVSLSLKQYMQGACVSSRNLWPTLWAE